MKLNKDDFNWYGFEHDKVLDRYKCDRYVGTFSIKNSSKPCAVYYSSNPDRSLGHKDYVILYKDPVLLQFFVTGMDAPEMEEYRFQDGLQCPSCADVIYSITRHDYRHCKCGETMIDGGRDYTRRSAAGLSVTVDLLEGTAEYLTPAVE